MSNYKNYTSYRSTKAVEDFVKEIERRIKAGTLARGTSRSVIEEALIKRWTKGEIDHISTEK